jgi:hypothetical protein
MEARMASREVAVKRYVVRLSAEERERLEGLRRKGEIPATRLTKVLKADISEAGELGQDADAIAVKDGVRLKGRHKKSPDKIA